MKNMALIIGLVSCMTIACDPFEEDISGDPGLRLTYSTDTLIFDTLLSNVGSFTERIIITNPNNKAISIDRISLGYRDESAYSIIVNGADGDSFEDEVVFGNDSILVLVDVLIDPMNEDLPYLVKDSLVVEYNGNRDDVKLVSWGQDANFIDSQIIPCDAIWDSPKPYVIYNFALVDTLCTLTVLPGTTILIDNNAGLFVQGSLHVMGTAEDKVVIRNTRFDPEYIIAPGQWDGIYFLEGSFDNIIDHAIIRNGQTGLRIGNPSDNEDFELTVSNTSIGHMSIAGIRSFTSDVRLVNCEIFDCQFELLGAFLGGRYDINHCTFSNYENLFNRDQTSVVFSDFIPVSDSEILTSDLQVHMINSIVWGDLDEEMAIALSGEAAVEITAHDNIVRSTNETIRELGNTLSLENNYPGFLAPLLFNYQLDSLSPARDIAQSSGVTHDILGTERDEMPDLGAFERKDSIP